MCPPSPDFRNISTIPVTSAARGFVVRSTNTSVLNNGGSFSIIVLHSRKHCFGRAIERNNRNPQPLSNQPVDGLKRVNFHAHGRIDSQVQ